MFTLKVAPQKDADVIVVGGGPAGASTAAYLARAGQRVLLLDQHTFPRDKVCGDFVGPVALVELNRLGVAARPEYRATNVIYRAAVHIDGKQLISSSMPETPGLPSYGRVIPRQQLDAWIVDAARSAGVELLQGWRVTGYSLDSRGVTVSAQRGRQKQAWRASVLVGADGSSSLIARQMHGTAPSARNRIIAVRAYYEGVGGEPEQADLYFSSESFPGYYWLFPTGSTSANVGIGMLLETLPEATEHLPALLEALVEQDPAFQERLRSARRVGKIAGWPLSTYDPSIALVGERVLLSGDAAGLINPLNGEGIQYALLSGRWASQAVLDAARQEDFSAAALHPYERTVERELRYDMALAGMIVKLIRNRSMNSLWMQSLKVILARAKADPIYADITGGVLAGVQPASSVIQPRILRGTVQQAAFTFGIGTAKSMLRGPRRLAQAGMETVQAGAEMAAAAARSPEEYAGWGVEVAKGAIELAAQMALSAVSRLPADEPQPSQNGQRLRAGELKLRLR